MLMGKEVERSSKTLVNTVKDYRSGTVGFYQHDLEHLTEHHQDMVSHMDAIVDTIQDPDAVYYDMSECADPNGQEFYKNTKLLKNPNLRVKVVVAYDDATWTDGHFVTAHKVRMEKRKGESDAFKIYEADRQK